MLLECIRNVFVSVLRWGHLKFKFWIPIIRGPSSVVGIATGYRLDGPGIESRWGWDFPHLSRPSLGPTMGTGSFLGVKSGRGVTLTPHPLLVLWGIELYLYSPYGPYGLYRASVPVQECTLPVIRTLYIYIYIYIREQGWGSVVVFRSQKVPRAEKYGQHCLNLISWLALTRDFTVD
jgi:hypothetical protein